jgi:cyclase
MRVACLAALCGILLVRAPALLAQQPDFSKVEIRATTLGAGLYLLQGAGGNMTAFMGADGVLLVDDEFAPLADRIRASLQGLGAQRPVRFIVNTHYHYDHTGGDLPFAESGAIVIAQDAVRPRLASGGTAGNGGSVTREIKPVAGAALPTVTYDHELTLHLNGAEVRVVHYPAAHTDGDSIVYFPAAHVVAMGDIYVRYGFPFIDVNAGGSVQGMIRACEDVLRTVPADTRIVPGHGELASVDELREYLAMLTGTTAAVERALRSGKSLEQMQRSHLLGAWSARYSPPKAFIDTDAFTESLYYSLRHSAPRGKRGSAAPPRP